MSMERPMKHTRLAATRVALTFLLAATSLALPSCSDRNPATLPVAAAPVPLTLTECTVIGASVSAGCEASLPGFRTASLLEPQGHCTFASVLGAITQAPAPSGGGDTMFFLNPAQIATKQIAQARAANPKILFAVDFLFWHGYGDRMDAAARMTRLDEGLAALDTFTCPIIIGDLPDMSHSGLISRAQTPDKETLGKLNEKIAAWSAQRPRVVVIPLFETVGKAIRSEPLTFGGRSFDAAGARQLLTLSGLHVTPDGLIALSHECLNQLRQRGLLAANLTWDTDAAAVMQRLIDAKKAADGAKVKPKAG